MTELKDLADIADRLIYEVIALLIPGALFALLLAAMLGPGVIGDDAWSQVIAFGDAHPVVSAAVSYALGYVVQGLSRAVTHRLHASLKWLWDSVRLPRNWINRKLSDARVFVEKKIFRWPHNAQQTEPTEPEKPSIDLDKLVIERLSQRLGLDPAHRLNVQSVQDLAFSALVPEIKRLERFRAAGSCARGLATVVAIGWLALVAELALGLFSDAGWPITWGTAASAIGLTFVFNALMNRERMYEALWRGIIAPQFLISATRNVTAPTETDPAALGHRRHS